jgi:hypothetical protein
MHNIVIAMTIDVVLIPFRPTEQRQSVVFSCHDFKYPRDKSSVNKTCVVIKTVFRFTELLGFWTFFIIRCCRD